jgi:hypothetical protein
VRGQAAGALGGREGQDVTAALLVCLADQDPGVRGQAAGALGGRGSALDLLALARHISRIAQPSDLLGVAYHLTARHYRALPADDQKMIRTTMGRLTSASLPDG